MSDYTEVTQETVDEVPLTPFDFLDQQNITQFLTDRQLDEIGQKVIREYEIDENNFAPRKERIQELYKLALQVKEVKNYPFDNASNTQPTHLHG